jgi:hypothetical protein
MCLTHHTHRHDLDGGVEGINTGHAADGRDHEERQWRRADRLTSTVTWSPSDISPSRTQSSKVQASTSLSLLYYDMKQS